MKRLGLLPVLLLFLLPSLKALGEEHVIERGETALQIAIDHNLSMAQLQQLNPGVDLEMMLVGDILTVPDSDTSFEEFLSKRYGELIRINGLHCQTIADQNALCLFHLENRSQTPLFDVVFHVSVQGTNGMEGESSGHIGLIQILPGEELPAFLEVTGPFGEIAAQSAEISNLDYSEHLQSSFRIPDTLFIKTDRFLPDRIAGTAVIDFSQEAIEQYQKRKINVLAAGYSADGELVGVRSLYSAFYPSLEITVYSTGAPIEKITVRMEAY